MKVVLLGSGNVATHLGKAMHQAGHKVLQVWSRTIQNALQLAKLLDASATDSISQLNNDADIYIVSVSDDAIASLVDQFRFPEKMLVHTSGTASLEVLEAASAQTGVFYPLQTFSKVKPVDFSKVPVAIEGSSKQVEEILLTLAASLTKKTVVFDSEKRKSLHVAAVFACNFSNHLYTIASEILKESGLDFDLIRPLIAETSDKVQYFFPHEVQTGPAVRRDQNVINKHLTFLNSKPELKELYESLSQNIINFHQKP
ncbi:Rossmann-like and DUF2520 domain-containing protein [Desertivirga xinjiangensis]|uniref:Rossmann-like and DUF2520 domain-containing protein n=1 Tax=Desertivirga xinjiangensis TaxID=539206 RepID=UPI00210B60A6|nr:DUF2520 domain-containing protein [Pedobacter xinjiangensis]